MDPRIMDNDEIIFDVKTSQKKLSKKVQNYNSTQMYKNNSSVTRYKSVFRTMVLLKLQICN